MCFREKLRSRRKEEARNVTGGAIRNVRTGQRIAREGLQTWKLTMS